MSPRVNNRDIISAIAFSSQKTGGRGGSLPKSHTGAEGDLKMGRKIVYPLSGNNPGRTTGEEKGAGNKRYTKEDLLLTVRSPKRGKDRGGGSIKKERAIS